MDINSDGHPDILSGSYSRMEQSMAGLFQVLCRAQAAGQFVKPAVLNGTDREPLIIPIKGEQDAIPRTSARGRWRWIGMAMASLDLVVGNFAGKFLSLQG